MTTSARRSGRRAQEPEIRLSDASPADLVATVWYRLGYRPADSLVMVALDAETGRLGFTLRCDLPAGPAEPAALSLVRGMYLPVRATGHDQVLVLQFAAGLPVDPPPLPVPLLEGEVRRLGGAVLDVLGVGESGYRSLRCTDETCCPVAGHPLVEIESSRAAATFTATGRAVVPTEAELVTDVTSAPASDARGVASALDRLRRDPLDPESRIEWWQRWVAAFDAGSVPAGEAAALGPGLHDAQLRDAVLLTALGGDLPGLAEVVRIGLERSDGDGMVAYVGSGMSVLFDEVLGLSPETERRAAVLERSRVVLASVARAAAPGARAGALAVLAMLAWYQGNTTRARLLVDLAFADRPGQSLARLAGELLRSGTAPSWLPDPWLSGRESSGLRHPGLWPPESWPRSPGRV